MSSHTLFFLNVTYSTCSCLFPLAINGYVYGNLPSPKVCVGRPVSWHLFGIGNEVDIHSAYFHGHTLMDRKHRTDVLSLFPATFVTATMIPRTKGKWLLSCQVNDHIQGTVVSVLLSFCHLCVKPIYAPVFLEAFVSNQWMIIFSFDLMIMSGIVFIFVAPFLQALVLSFLK